MNKMDIGKYERAVERDPSSIPAWLAYILALERLGSTHLEALKQAFGLMDEAVIHEFMSGIKEDIISIDGYIFLVGSYNRLSDNYISISVISSTGKKMDYMLFESDDEAEEAKNTYVKDMLNNRASYSDFYNLFSAVVNRDLREHFADSELLDPEMIIADARMDPAIPVEEWIVFTPQSRIDEIADSYDKDALFGWDGSSESVYFASRSLADKIGFEFPEDNNWTWIAYKHAEYT